MIKNFVSGQKRLSRKIKPVLFHAKKMHFLSITSELLRENNDVLMPSSKLNKFVLVELKVSALRKDVTISARPCVWS